MPYISAPERETIEEALGEFHPENGGELQYAIASLIDRYYTNVAFEEGGVRYKHMEEMMGALNGANLEHYRMVVAPYEDLKIKQNGDVYNVRYSGQY